MPVRFLKHIALEIPVTDREKAVAFYQDFGLEKFEQDDEIIAFGCKARQYPSLYLVVGENRKKIHHVAMGTSVQGLEDIVKKVDEHGFVREESPKRFDASGIWFRNPHGLLFHVDVCPEDTPVQPEAPFLVNTPGNTVRVNAGALPPKSMIINPKPRKLGHALLFTPNVEESIIFLEQILGMRLSDRSQDVVAFLHCQGGSDHHVLALAKSNGIGLHHMSFLVGTPDEVGVGGCRMVEKWSDPGWGFGRHAIGSNFFHYIRDPWGSYVEYYCDLDYIADSDSWEAKDWPLEDSLHAWGPNPPEDFVHNYEQD